MKADRKGKRTSVRNVLDRLLDRLDGNRSMTAEDYRRELGKEKEREKKPLTPVQKILIGIAVLLVLALPALVMLLWTISGYFWQKNL